MAQEEIKTSAKPILDSFGIRLVREDGIPYIILPDGQKVRVFPWECEELAEIEVTR